MSFSGPVDHPGTPCGELASKVRRDPRRAWPSGLLTVLSPNSLRRCLFSCRRKGSTNGRKQEEKHKLIHLDPSRTVGAHGHVCNPSGPHSGLRHARRLRERLSPQQRARALASTTKIAFALSALPAYPRTSIGCHGGLHAELTYLRGELSRALFHCGSALGGAFNHVKVLLGRLAKLA